MRIQGIAHLLGWMFLSLAVLALFPLLIAVSVDTRETVTAFVVTIIGSGFVGGALVLSTRGSGPLDMRRLGVLIVAMFWLVLPIWGALPFHLAGTAPSIVAAYFEATSGLTTTGATVFDEISLLPRAIVVWRAELQWIGGLATLSAWAILVAPDVRSPLFDPSLAPTSLQSGSKWLPRSVFATIAPLYTGLTFLCFLALAVAGMPAFDAICLAFATVSTGGFMPRDGTLVSYGLPGVLWVVTIFMVIGAVSLFWVRGLLGRQLTVVRGNPEPYWIVTALLLLTAYLLIVALPTSTNERFASILEATTVIIATAASHITTTGFAVSDVVHTQLPLVLILALTFVGAGRYSTAGGLKFQRIGVMFTAARREFHHLVFPHSAIGGARAQPARTLQTEEAIWVNFFVVTAAVTVLALIMSVAGLNLTASLLAAVSAIGNMGPAYDLAASSDIAGRPTYSEMPPGAQLALAIGMVFGRFEVLALLTLFNLAYWRA